MPRLRFPLLLNLVTAWLIPASIWSCQNVSPDQAARGFESEGRWDQALASWSVWEPVPPGELYCATCWRYARGRKEYHIGICLERLGEPEAAKELYWKALGILQTDEALECARRLLDLHQSTGTIIELRQKVSALMPKARETEAYQWLTGSIRESQSATFLDEAKVIEIARKEIESRESWGDKARYEARREGEEWHILILRVDHSPDGKEVFTPGGQRLVIVDGQGKVIRYLLGR